MDITRRSWTSRILMVTVLGLFGLPMIFIGIRSLSWGWRWPEVLPEAINLRAWRVLWQDPQLLPALLNTWMVGSVVVGLNLIIAIPGGKALAHYTFPGKTLLETLITLPIIIPSLLIAMGLHLTMLRLGLANHWLGVALIHLLPTLPYSIRIMRAAFESWGIKWEEQGRNLGVAGWQLWWTLWIPLLLPSIRSLVALTFIISLSQYVLTALIGGGTVLTLAMVYFPCFSGSDSGVVAAFSMVFAIIPLVFLAVVEGLIRLILPGSIKLQDEV